MKAGQSHITDEILVKYLLGEASEGEKARVLGWIDKNEANKKHFYHFKLIWDESRNLAAKSTIDENDAWVRFKERTSGPVRRTIPLSGRFNWLKIAAMLLLLAGGGFTVWYNMIRNTPPQVASHIPDSPVNKLFREKSAELVNTPIAGNRSNTGNQTIVNNPEQVKSPATIEGSNSTKEHKVKQFALQKNATAKANTKFLKVKYEPTLNNYNHSREFICNATPCPLEICIIQTVKCPGGELSAISTCSILEPDESGQLKYKSFDKITKNCKANIEEIRIKRVSTGETIVLNSDSKPTTAQEFFNYITGEKKGDFVAGNFHTDCNNHSEDCGLTFNNDFGSLILQ